MKSPSSLSAIARWLDRYQPPGSVVLGLAAVLVGLTSGIGIWVFKRLIELFQELAARVGVRHPAPGRRIFIPQGDTLLEAGDVLTVVAEGKAREEVRRICTDKNRDAGSSPGKDKVQ